MRKKLNFNRVVVKVGSSSLTYDNGKLSFYKIERLVRQLADLKNRGVELILVTSGAIGAGMGILGYDTKPATIPEKQACAAVGQGSLMHLYEKYFAEYGNVVGQILLTKEDVSDRKRFLNARHTLDTMLKAGIIPIINENDAIAVSEIKIGDNDTLSALVSTLVNADVLILLSDVDGLFDKNPSEYDDAEIIKEVFEIDDNILSLAGGSSSKVGTGGMKTKIDAAVISVSSGVNMIISNSETENVLLKILNGEEIGTLFVAKEHKLKLKKNWIAYNAKSEGTLYVDEGAKNAVLSDKSLLPSGIVEVSGEFRRGDTVDIKYKEDIIAKGLVNFSSEDLILISGKKSSEFEKILGRMDYDEAVHKNNLVLKAVFTK